MSIDPNRFGLSCAITTPMREGGSVDLPRLVTHARHVLAQGCDSVTLFGTTGEGAMIAPSQRMRALETLLALAERNA